MKRSILILCGLLCTTILPQSSPETTEQSTKKIINGIKKKDVAVYKFMAWRHPESFSCYVNGKKINPNEEIQIPQGQKKVVIGYCYDWYTPWGNKKGRKKVAFALDEKAPHHTINFDGWKTENRIQLSGAKKIGQEVPF